MIELPFPDAALSGQNNKHFWKTRPITNAHRKWAKDAMAATGAKVEGTGDILVSVTFHAPNNLGDRCNYPNRMKAYWDGIADALKVNDRRFLPSFHYGPNEKPGRVVVTIGGQA